MYEIYIKIPLKKIIKENMVKIVLFYTHFIPDL